MHSRRRQIFTSSANVLRSTLAFGMIFFFFGYLENSDREIYRVMVTTLPIFYTRLAKSVFVSYFVCCAATTMG